MADVPGSLRLDMRLDGRLLFVQFVEEESFSCEVTDETVSLTATVAAAPEVSPPPVDPPVDPVDPPVDPVDPPVDVPTPREV